MGGGRGREGGGEEEKREHLQRDVGGVVKTRACARVACTFSEGHMYEPSNFAPKINQTSHTRLPVGPAAPPPLCSASRFLSPKIKPGEQQRQRQQLPTNLTPSPAPATASLSSLIFLRFLASSDINSLDEKEKGKK